MRALLLTAMVVVLCAAEVYPQDQCSATRIAVVNGKSELAALKDRADPKKTIVYKSPVTLGSAKFAAKGICQIIQASLIDDFFDNLRRESRDGRVAFLVNGETREKYPAKTTIEIDSIVVACEGPSSANTLAGILKAEKNSLRFEALDGHLLLPSTTETSKSPWKENALAVEKTTHLIHIDTSATPLPDTLTIKVYRDEHYLGCISGSL